MGSASLYHLARRGLTVLGLDMFPEGHDQGSSHGEHRMIRASAGSSSYRPTDGYVPLVARAFDLWAELEAESGENLVKILGEVSISTDDTLAKWGVTLDDLRNNEFRELLTREELASRFPGIQPLDGVHVTYEGRAGYLRPEKAISAHLSVAERHGAEIRRPEEVVAWKSGHDGVTVTTADADYSAGHLVIAAGAFTEELLGGLDLPLEVTRIVKRILRTNIRPLVWRERRARFSPLGSGREFLRHAGRRGCRAKDRAALRSSDDGEDDRPEHPGRRDRIPSDGPRQIHAWGVWPGRQEDHLHVHHDSGRRLHRRTTPGPPERIHCLRLLGTRIQVLTNRWGRSWPDFATRGATEHEIEFLSSGRFEVAGVSS